MSGQEPHAHPALPPSPLFGRARSLLVCPDGAAVKECHAEFDAIALLCPLQQPFPDIVVTPSVEQLCGHPPRAEMGRDAAPFRAVAMPPDDRLDGAPQIAAFGLVVRATLLDQGCQFGPLRVGQNAMTRIIRHHRDKGIYLRV